MLAETDTDVHVNEDGSIEVTVPVDGQPAVSVGWSAEDAQRVGSQLLFAARKANRTAKP